MTWKLFSVFALVSICRANGRSTDIRRNQRATFCNEQQVDIEIERCLPGLENFQVAAEDMTITGTELDTILSDFCSGYTRTFICFLDIMEPCQDYDSPSYTNVLRGDSLCNESVPQHWLRSAFQNLNDVDMMCVGRRVSRMFENCSSEAGELSVSSTLRDISSVFRCLRTALPRNGPLRYECSSSTKDFLLLYIVYLAEHFTLPSDTEISELKSLVVGQ